MAKFEIIFSDIVEADDFFDAVDMAKQKNQFEILSVSAISEDDEYVFEE